MAIGDVSSVDGVPGCYYVDTGMFDTAEYGAVYIYDTTRPAIIDTGIGTNYHRILSALETVDIAPSNLEVIALTHAHLDHAGGAGYIAAETDATVYVPENATTFIEAPDRLWEGTKQAVGSQIKYYTEPKPVPRTQITPLQDRSTIDLGDLELTVYPVPGHAFHQVVFHEPESNAVFTADAAGIYIPTLDEIRPTSPPPDFDLEEVVNDARRISDLDPDTLCFPHFGPTPAGTRLSTYINVITNWVDAIQTQRANAGDDEAVITHFVETTDLDAVWGQEKATGEVTMNVRGALNYLDTQS